MLVSFRFSAVVVIPRFRCFGLMVLFVDVGGCRLFVGGGVGIFGVFVGRAVGATVAVVMFVLHRSFF